MTIARPNNNDQHPRDDVLDLLDVPRAMSEGGCLEACMTTALETGNPEAFYRAFGAYARVLADKSRTGELTLFEVREFSTTLARQLARASGRKW